MMNFYLITFWSNLDFLSKVLKIKFDLKGHRRSNKAIVAKFFLSQSLLIDFYINLYKCYIKEWFCDFSNLLIKLQP